MRYALMIEAQQGLSYLDQLAIARRAEAAGFETLLRSDHYESFPGSAGRPTTDAWSVIAGLARDTERIRLGVLVSPVTFRHPGAFAKAVATVHEMSGGRVEAGLGAGWNEDEHRRHGFAFPPIAERADMLEEQLAIVRGLWTEPDGWSFAGSHYRVEDTIFHARPVPPPGLIVGGEGSPRSLRIAARHADEFNVTGSDPARVADRLARLDEACRAIGRDPATIRRSAMVGALVARDADGLAAAEVGPARRVRHRGRGGRLVRDPRASLDRRDTRAGACTGRGVRGCGCRAAHAPGLPAARPRHDRPAWARRWSGPDPGAGGGAQPDARAAGLSPRRGGGRQVGRVVATDRVRVRADEPGPTAPRGAGGATAVAEQRSDRCGQVGRLGDHEPAGRGEPGIELGGDVGSTGSPRSGARSPAAAERLAGPRDPPGRGRRSVETRTSPVPVSVAGRCPWRNVSRSRVRGREPGALLELEHELAGRGPVRARGDDEQSDGFRRARSRPARWPRGLGASPAARSARPPGRSRPRAT